MDGNEGQGSGLRRFAEVVEQHMADGEQRPILRVHSVGSVERLTDPEIYEALHGIVEKNQLPAGSFTFRIGVEGVF